MTKTEREKIQRKLESHILPLTDAYINNEQLSLLQFQLLLERLESIEASFDFVVGALDTLNEKIESVLRPAKA